MYACLIFVLSVSYRVDMIMFFFSRFINARRRIVQPMIDQSNRAGRAALHSVFNVLNNRLIRWRRAARDSLTDETDVY